MDSIANFLVVIDAYCAARGISEARASTLILNGGSRLAAIRSGVSDIGARTLDKAVQWLSDHWPDDKAPWPTEVPRPPKSAVDDSPPSGSGGAGPAPAEDAPRASAPAAERAAKRAEATARAKPLRCFSPHGLTAPATEGQSR